MWRGLMESIEAYCSHCHGNIGSPYHQAVVAPC